MCWNERSEDEPRGKDIEKEHGSTTLEQCGWCIHASGTHRHSYCISGSCRLNKSYSKDVKWSDKCHLKGMSKNDISALVNNHQYQIKNAESTIKREKEYIEVLKELAAGSSDRPCLPDDRKHDHFNIDDKIVLAKDGAWVFGEVEWGYRHQDGCVSYRLYNEGPQKQDFWGVGCAVPIILLKSEYDFFAQSSATSKSPCTSASSDHP